MKALSEHPPLPPRQGRDNYRRRGQPPATRLLQGALGLEPLRIYITQRYERDRTGERRACESHNGIEREYPLGMFSITPNGAIDHSQPFLSCGYDAGKKLTIVPTEDV